MTSSRACHPISTHSAGKPLRCGHNYRTGFPPNTRQTLNATWNHRKSTIEASRSDSDESGKGQRSRGDRAGWYCPLVLCHHISALGADCIRVMHGRAGAESGPRSASASVIRDMSEPSELVTSQNRLGTDVWRARQGGAPGLAGCREDKEVDE